MREIKFRGMDVKGNWHTGNLSVLAKDIYGGAKVGTYISNSCGMPFAYEVRPETVGQFTGEKSISGKEIFEGDIVTGDSWKEPYAMKTKKTAIGRVAFTNTYGFTFTTNNIDGSYRSLPTGCRTVPNLTNCEVIGTIHENPELING